MSSKYKFLDPDGFYFVSFATVSWIDVFTRNEYRQILLDSWKHCREMKGLRIHAWVIMTNHVHMILSRNGNNLPEDIMRDMKKFTSFKLLGEIMKNQQESRKEWMLNIFKKAGEENSNNTQYQFWQQDNHPVWLDNDEKKKQRLNYLHENPVRAGYVDKAEEYLYSSARDYYFGKQQGLMEIDFCGKTSPAQARVPPKINIQLNI